MILFNLFHGDKKIHTISLKVCAVVELEFELIYFEVVVRHVYHNAFLLSSDNNPKKVQFCVLAFSFLFFLTN